jgi:hypothetical protein
MTAKLVLNSTTQQHFKTNTQNGANLLFTAKGL